jgi:acetyl-CoA carboxylase carboxyltransferase component
MSSKHLRGDINYAWPTAEIAVMGAEGAVNIIYRSALAKAKDKDKTKQELIKEYRERFDNPYIAAARGYIDNVIDPRLTRPKLIRALGTLEKSGISHQQKKHGNIPL